MKRTRTFILLAIAAALALPALATAKGPSSATLSGPGIDGAVPVQGDGEGGSGPLGTIVQQAGYFPLIFGQSPDPTLRSRPRGDLGAAYTIRYRVPGGGSQLHTLVQTVYPYATGGPVFHMRPNQVVWDGQVTLGGWFRAPVAVKAALVESGLPATPPGGGSGFWWSPPAYATVAAASLLAVLLVLGAAAGLRRRHGPATAH